MNCKGVTSFESVLMRWMNLEPIIQSEVSQKEKDKYCILMHVKRLWCIYTMEYYSATKGITCESVLMRWMTLEPVIQSEVSQKEKKISYINAYIWNQERWY